MLGERHYNVAEKVREHLARYRELEDIIAMLGIEELSPPTSGGFARTQIATLSHSTVLRGCRAYRADGRIGVFGGDTVRDCEGLSSAASTTTERRAVLHARQHAGEKIR